VTAVIDTREIDVAEAGLDDDWFDEWFDSANRRIRGRVVSSVLHTVALVLLLTAAWCLWPARWGGTFSEVVVSGHSMEPVFHTGDLVVTKKSEHYRIGDKVVYEIPKGEPGAGIHVVHRIIGVRADGTFVLQGDNRVTPDDWRPSSHDVLGRVVAMVPQAGSMLLWTSRPLVLAGLAGLIITVWLWPPREVRERTPADTEDHLPGEGNPADVVVLTHPTFEPVTYVVRRGGPWWADEDPNPRSPQVVLDWRSDPREPARTLSACSSGAGVGALSPGALFLGRDG
jgi:signal peptidase